MKHRLLALLALLPLAACVSSPEDEAGFAQLQQRAQLAGIGLHDVAKAIAPDDADLAAQVELLATVVETLARAMEASGGTTEGWLGLLDEALLGLEPLLSAEDAELRAAVAFARLVLAQIRIEVAPPADPPPSK